MGKPNYSPEFIKKVTKNARAVARLGVGTYFFLKPHKEDIESWAFLQYIEGRDLRTPWSYIVVDYIRAHYGRGEYSRGHSKEKPIDEIIEKNLRQETKDPMEQAQEEQLNRILWDTVKLYLTEKEAYIVELYYRGELGLKEIAHLMGVTESRISQIHTKAVCKLQLALNKVLTDV